MLTRIANYKQDWKEAQKWLQKGLECFPEYPWLWYFSAVNSWVLQEQEEFLHALNQAKELSPQAEFLPGLYWLKANLFSRQGNWPQVRQALTAGFESNRRGIFEKILAQKDLNGLGTGLTYL